MFKRYFFTSLAVASLIFAGAGCAVNQATRNNQPSRAVDQARNPAVEAPNSPMVGADRDDHGCIGSAGYSWCAAKGKCLRIWEEDCPTEEVNAPVQPEQPTTAPINEPSANVDVGAKVAGTDQSCTSSGGKVSSAMCCQSVGDFPDNCLIGACGCSPDYSHTVKTCDCGEGKCFNGQACVSR